MDRWPFQVRIIACSIQLGEYILFVVTYILQMDTKDSGEDFAVPFPGVHFFMQESASLSEIREDFFSKITLHTLLLILMTTSCLP